MKRREFVAVAASATCAGVVGASSAGDLASVSRPDRLDGASASDADAATADAATAEGPRTTSTGEETEPAASTLEVLSTVSGTVSVRLRLVRADGAVVRDDGREFSYGERAHLSGLMTRGETYAFVLAVEGETLVRGTVSPGERAVFELVDESTVTVLA